MNVLFVLYGDLSTNSAIPMALHAAGLEKLGHRCAVAIPARGPVDAAACPVKTVTYAEALANTGALFADGKPADLVHAWTPREGVRRFVTAYLARHPAPLVIYLEDNEEWIARSAMALVGMHAEVLHQHSEAVISTWTPEGLPHLLRHAMFVGLADAAVVIQDKLAAEVPPWVPCTTVMPGVDLTAFGARAADPGLRKQLGIAEGERVIVYPGGLNDFTRPGLESLCRAVGIINQRGVPCRLVRTGPVALDFLDRVPPEAAAATIDMGLVPRDQMPALLALADIQVQPGKPNPFEDLRLPGKLPELFASGRPVVLPDTNIANLLRDGVDAVLHRTGTAEEIAEKCLALFADPARARAIGEAGRRFAETHFDPSTQAARLEKAHAAARAGFDAGMARKLWTQDSPQEPVHALLARRLRLLAAGNREGVPNAGMLAAYARAIESAQERYTGLEAGLEVRDRDLAARKERIEKLDRSLADANDSINKINAILGRRDRELATKEEELVDRRAHIAALEGSLTWRLTRPLRWLLGVPGQALERLRAGPRTALELGLRPLGPDPLPVGNTDGPPRWVAESSDSAFRASVARRDRPIRPGWYRAHIALASTDGRLAGPRVYIPFPGGGYAEFRSVELIPQGDEYSAEFHVAHATTELRFDPSVYPCEFECGALHLVPISGRGRSVQTAVGTLRVISKLNWRQLVVWVGQGTRLLLSQGPKALWDAAYWAVRNHARAHAVQYPEWVREYAQPTPALLAEMAEDSTRLARRPLISLITPVFNPPEPFLRAMIDSVLAQAYPNWELCLADDASTQPYVRKVLEEYAARDSRIKVAWREKNGHISAASNTALGLASGEFVALLDHDDALPPDALYWVARAINDHPEAALLYSDEDKLDFEGARILPYFKCDWNYDLFMAHNLITHLGVYRADIVRAIGGFREGFEGAQDYDLALRFIERIEPTQIHHIPRVLYHWRMLVGSTSVAAGEKNYAAERARLAIAEHLKRIGARASAETVPVAVQRVRYEIAEPAPHASIIIPTRNGQKLVRQCLESIRAKTTYAPYEIVLIDNGSDDAEAIAYFAALERDKVVHLLKDPRPFNFSRLNNDGARLAHGEFLVFLNNDITVITPEWLTELVSQAQRPEIGAVGAKLWYPNDTIQHAGLILVAGLAGHAHLGKRRGDDGYFSRANLHQWLSAVTGACLCVRRAVFDEVGGFDETLAVAFNDVDLCLKIQAAGYRNLYTPYAELYHHESASRGYEDTPAKMKRFQEEADILRERWMPVLMNDPYYNPNLTLSGEPFTLAWPPRVAPFRPWQPPQSQT